jgi:hypothetical protein
VTGRSPAAAGRWASAPVDVAASGAVVVARLGGPPDLDEADGAQQGGYRAGAGTG